MANKETVNIKFAEIPQLIVQSIPERKEYKTSTYVNYGVRNDYPTFLWDAYSKCPTLQTVVNGFADYVVGDGVSCSVLSQPNPVSSWDDLYTHLAADYVLYGECFIQVIRNKKGNVSELYWLDALYVRSDEDNETFYYNEDFGKSYVKASKTVIFPKFKAEFEQPSSVVCIKTPLGKGTYSLPLWHSALKAVMTEIAIDDFHLNEIENNFLGSAVINFNAGVPSEEEQDELEKKVAKKFSGHQNAGRFLLSFNNGVTNKTTIDRLATDDFDKRYESLATKTQRQIFTAFGVSPVVFGVEKENTGFNDEDYQQAFKLFNRTKIKPIQARLNDALDKVFEQKGSMTVKPFTINFDNNSNETTVN